MKKLCPLPKHGEARCDEEKCAWWCGEYKAEQGITLGFEECAMTRISTMLQSLEEGLTWIKYELQEQKEKSCF